MKTLEIQICFSNQSLQIHKSKSRNNQRNPILTNPRNQPKKIENKTEQNKTLQFEYKFKFESNSKQNHRFRKKILQFWGSTVARSRRKDNRTERYDEIENSR